MKLLYLNKVYHDAVKAEKLSLKDILNEDSIFKIFSYDDIYEIADETNSIINQTELKGLGFSNLLDKIACFQEEDTFKIEVLDSSLNGFDISDLTCTCLDAEVALLYAQLEPSLNKRSIAENIFIAMSEMQHIDEVIRSTHFQHYMDARSRY